MCFSSSNVSCSLMMCGCFILRMIVISSQRAASSSLPSALIAKTSPVCLWAPFFVVLDSVDPQSPRITYVSLGWPSVCGVSAVTTFAWTFSTAFWASASCRISRIFFSLSPSIVPTKRPPRFITASLSLQPGLIQPQKALCPMKPLPGSAPNSRSSATASGSVRPMAKMSGEGPSTPIGTSIQVLTSGEDSRIERSCFMSTCFLSAESTFARGLTCCSGGVSIMSRDPLVPKPAWLPMTSFSKSFPNSTLRERKV
mmetsp:Transcript_60600/g.170767  ORF Transcript_60600/g.170767 Transcript_60600/m.170767 type:complete len:255 (+) Transcript_60600:1307-2071(+)